MRSSSLLECIDGRAALGALAALCLWPGGPASAQDSESLGPPVERALDDVANHYARLAFEMYEDSLLGARVLQQRIEAFVDAPSPTSHTEAKRAWIDARRAYSQTEALRFGNPNVDAWEGGVNAWPIDEGFLDYVAPGYEHDLGNPHARANLIASDLALDPGAIRLQHERDGLEPNVATGFHAIELLLWGQDVPGPSTAAGQRSHTDYLPGPGCTHPPCDRRGRYLRLVANLLVFDLRKMVEDWHPELAEGYATFYSTLPPRERLRRMVVGLGTMSAGELAGERLSVALLAGSQEDEQSCFSDTTHLDVYYNALGIERIYRGRYERSDGRSVEGPSLSALVRERAPSLDRRLREQLERSLELAAELRARGEAGLPFDQMILASQAEARARIERLIDALTALAESFEELRLRLESDGLAGVARASRS